MFACGDVAEGGIQTLALARIIYKVRIIDPLQSAALVIVPDEGLAQTVPLAVVRTCVIAHLEDIVFCRHTEGDRETAGQQQAVPFPAAQGTDRASGPVRRKQEVLQVTQHMAFHAVQRDVGLTVADVFHQGLVFPKPGPHLVKVGHLQVRPQPNRSAFRRKFPQDQPQERGLSRTVGANNPYAVTTENFRGEVTDQGRAIVRIVHVGKAGHQAAGLFRLGNLHVHVPYAGAPGRPFLPHLDKGANTALVPGTACLDSLTDPDFFFGQFLVKKGVGLFLFGQSLVPELHELVVGEIPAAHAATVQVKNSGSHPPDKSPVVTHKKNGTVQAGDDSLQPLYGGNVQMAGGFVQQKQVRILSEGPCKEHATLLPAGKAVE